MRPGGGKAKGAQFERVTCVRLSLWVSNKKRGDLFWRTAMSGGRATRRRNEYGEDLAAHGGDICATHRDGHALTSRWYLECKHLRDLKISSFLISGAGPLMAFWDKIRQDCKAFEEEHEDRVQANRKPMLIAKQNSMPVLVITKIGDLERWTAPQLTSHARDCDISFFDDMVLERFQ